MKSGAWVDRTLSSYDVRANLAHQEAPSHNLVLTIMFMSLLRSGLLPMSAPFLHLNYFNLL